MTLAELAMQDVEDYNREIVAAGYSSSQVTKRLQTLKALIDRAGRPEFGLQTLTWNWDSRDVVHGKPGKQRALPSLKLLKKILEHCDLRERTMVWMAIGLGFGQSDLAVIRVGQIDEDSYDLRRGKTGIDRYGSTPPIVWAHIQAYLAESPRPEGQLMFVTHQGRPLVHGKCDSVRQWWRKLRESLGETSETMPGFYVLRHLGATEFGARPGCSISDMKRWLGHSASSRIADVYMRPVPPEHRKLVEWVRGQLSSRSLD